MSTIKLTEIADDVRPYLVAEPPPPLLVKEIRKTLMELCARTSIWRIFLDPITVTAGNALIEVSPDPSASIVEVLSASLSGVPLVAKTVEWLNEFVPGWTSTTGDPKYYTQMQTGELILAPVPVSRIQAGLKLVATQQPARNSSTIPLWIYDRYQEEIQNGTCSKLMLMPGKPWTDERNGADRRDKWTSCLGVIKAQASTSFGTASIRTRPCH